MKYSLILLAVVAVLPASINLNRPCQANPDPTTTAATQDRTQMLDGVKEIIAPGCLPGDLVVSGDQDFVLLTGRMGNARLPLAAAARYGKGRAIAVGHEGFFSGESLKNPDNTRFAANITAWTGRKPLAGLRVGLHNQDQALEAALSAAGCRVSDVKTEDIPSTLKNLDMLWLNQASLDGNANRPRTADVRKWVQNGGGLVITGPAWGWQSLHPTLDLATDHSGNEILLPMGIAFATGTLDETGSGGFQVDMLSIDLASARQALEALEGDANGSKKLSPPELSQVSTTLTQAVGILPAGPGTLTQQVEALCAAHGGDTVPSPQTPITTSMPYARLKARLDVEQWRHEKPDQITAAPAAAIFPGSIAPGATRETRTTTIDTHVPDWHGVGLYATPGEVVTITVPPTDAGKGLSVRVDAHTDTLWNLPKWERFPEISRTWRLDAPVTRIATPFGGTIYIMVPGGSKLGMVPVTISNAVAGPRFVRGVTSLEDWKQTLRGAPAPWAELEGKLVILTVPSSAVRTLDDPDALMAYWDGVMEKCYELYAAPRRSRPERYCVDQQISAGYMHSGYPVMTGPDVANTFCDLKTLQGSRGIRVWGFYHEMGHNFQRPEWTWDTFGEVTNNLFSLYGTEKINGVMVGAHPAMTAAEMRKRMETIAAAPGKEKYYQRDPWYPLTMFYLLRQGFGWEPFTRMFAEFRDLPNSERPKSDLQKRDQFLVRFSKLVGHNLTNYLTAWGVETSPAARASFASLPTWMPPDWPRP